MKGNSRGGRGGYGNRYNGPYDRSNNNNNNDGSTIKMLRNKVNKLENWVVAIMMTVDFDKYLAENPNAFENWKSCKDQAADKYTLARPAEKRVDNQQILNMMNHFGVELTRTKRDSLEQIQAIQQQYQQQIQQQLQQQQQQMQTNAELKNGIQQTFSLIQESKKNRHR